MLERQCAAIRVLYRSILFLLFACSTYPSQSLYSSQSESEGFTYYLNIADMINSLIAIPTSTVSMGSSTTNSQYLAGRAALYDENNIASGTCSTTFLSIENANGIITTYLIFSPQTMASFYLGSVKPLQAI